MKSSFIPSSRDGIEKMKSFKTLIENESDPYLRDVLESQYKICLGSPRAPCLAYDRASAFLINESTQLWTALHVVGPYIQDAVDRSPQIRVKTVKIPLKLFDAFGKMVFGQNGDFAVLEYIDPLFAKGQTTMANAVDYVKLRLSRPVREVPPLNFSLENDNFKPGAPVFLAGYPRLTTDRLTLGHAPDGDGTSLRVSIGKILSHQVGYQFWGEVFEDMPLGIQEFARERELHYDADSVPGNSGGPVLNANGKVIALHNSSTPTESFSFDPQRSSFAVRSNYLLNFTKIPIR